MRRTLEIILSWLPLAAAITLVSLLVYGTVQQNYRQSLNDPQIQMAEDAAAKMAKPIDLDGIFSSAQAGNMVDIALSLAPWMAVYDATGTPLLYSGELSGMPPHVPFSALQAARNDAGKDTTRQYESRITWQPEDGVREAIVIVWSPAAKQYVVAGRNMREGEMRESQLGLLVGSGLLLTLAASFFLQIGAYFIGTMRHHVRD